MISDLLQKDLDVIGQCLACVASGEVIADDWEFHTLFGIEFSVLSRIAGAWPKVDITDPNVALAVSNSLGNLIGYPHGKDASMKAHVAASPADIDAVLRRWHEAIGTRPSSGLVQ